MGKYLVAYDACLDSFLLYPPLHGDRQRCLSSFVFDEDFVFFGCAGA